MIDSGGLVVFISQRFVVQKLKKDMTVLLS